MQTVRRFRPTPSDAYLGNPHQGCCTFQYFNGDPLFPGTLWSDDGTMDFPPLPPRDPPGPRVYTHSEPIHVPVTRGYLPSTVAYCRWHWRFLEPEPGRYDFSAIDAAFARGRERGQSIAIRLMAFGYGGQPQLPDWYVARHPTAVGHHGSHAPDHDSDAYFAAFGGLLRAFAARFAAHPLLDTIDMAYIGPWGEGDGTCAPETCARFVALFHELFPAVPKLALINGEQMAAGIRAGSGWRADSFGDVGAVGSGEVLKPSSWNHMYDMYPDAIVRSGAAEAWRTAPVHLEVGVVPRYWYDQGYDLDFILEQGLKYHATYFMPKNTEIPEPWRERIAAFCRRLGYRFVYRQAMLDARVAADGMFRLHSWIENVGVAPLYRPYAFALRLRQDDHSEVVVLDGVDVRSWLPGDAIIDRRVRLPAGFRPGAIEVSAGIVDPVTREPRVSFAVEQVFSDRWALIGAVELVRD